MKIVIAGSSGLIGTELVKSLREDGHEIIRLVRRKPVASTEVFWDPAKGEIDSTSLAGSEGFINLAGAGVGDHRWTQKYKQLILSSRVDSTSLLARTAAQIKPKVFIAGSAIGWYGDTADTAVNPRVLTVFVDYKDLSFRENDAVALEFRYTVVLISFWQGEEDAKTLLRTNDWSEVVKLTGEIK
jgi:NAD dependent epimerase/dehydratase family enzyme